MPLAAHAEMGNMSRLRKGLFGFGVVVETVPGVLCLLAALVLVSRGAPGTVTGFVALVGLGLLFIAWVRLSR